MEKEILEQTNNQVNNTNNEMIFNNNQIVFENQSQSNIGSTAIEENNNIYEESKQIIKPTIEEKQQIFEQTIEKDKETTEEIKEVNSEIPKKKKKIKILHKFKKNKNDIEEEKIKPLVISRLLFISILDKIYLIAIILTLIILTYNNFQGNISSLGYNFMNRLKYEINIVIILIICYLILNWTYKCATKTILCLTEKEVYREWQIPFIKLKTNIPLNKITGVSSYNFLWIFRTIIIHQYGKLPLIFPTWNNEEFKNKLNELITTENKKIESNYEKNSLVLKKKYYIYFIILFIGIISILGITRFIAYSTSIEKDMVGTYKCTYKQYYWNKNYFITLKDDGTCDFNIDDDINNLESCDWQYDKENKSIMLYYEYYKRGYFYSSYPKSETKLLPYDLNERTITHNGWIFKRDNQNITKY